MARWYAYEGYDKNEISLEEKLLRDKLIDIMIGFTREMEGYSYFGSNPGISEDDYEDVADEILLAFKVEEK